MFLLTVVIFCPDPKILLHVKCAKKWIELTVYFQLSSWYNVKLSSISDWLTKMYRLSLDNCHGNAFIFIKDL